MAGQCILCGNSSAEMTIRGCAIRCAGEDRGKGTGGGGREGCLEIGTVCILRQLWNGALLSLYNYTTKDYNVLTQLRSHIFLHSKCGKINVSIKLIETGE